MTSVTPATRRRPAEGCVFSARPERGMRTPAFALVILEIDWPYFDNPEHSQRGLIRYTTLGTGDPLSVHTWRRPLCL